MSAEPPLANEFAPSPERHLALPIVVFAVPSLATVKLFMSPVWTVILRDMTFSL